MIRIIQLLHCNWDFFFVNSRSLLVKQRTKPPLLNFSVIAINQNNFLFTTREKSSYKVWPRWLWEISPNPGMRLMLMLFVSLQMIQAIQVLRFHLLELEKVIFVSLFPSLSVYLPPPPFFLLCFSTAEVQASGKFA